MTTLEWTYPHLSWAGCVLVWGACLLSLTKMYVRNVSDEVCIPFLHLNCLL